MLEVPKYGNDIDIIGRDKIVHAQAVGSTAEIMVKDKTGMDNTKLKINNKIYWREKQ